MKERPIIFSREGVCAILAGKKTQTRRIVTTRYPVTFIGSSDERNDPSAWGYFFDGPDHSGYMVLGRGHDERHDHGRTSIPCPFGVPGDRLWVRETWSHDAPDIDACRAAHEDASGGIGYGPYYLATEVAPQTLRWISPVRMPRWASRITLEVIDVRVQRLQEISEDDARAEGVALIARDPEGDCWSDGTHRTAFHYAWNEIHRWAQDGWNRNPWVWTVTFKRIEGGNQ